VQHVFELQRARLDIVEREVAHLTEHILHEHVTGSGQCAFYRHVTGT
jgi:hypothetical protein